MKSDAKTVEDALAIASRMEAYAALVVPCQHDGDGGDRKRKQKFNSVYTIEGKEQQTPVDGDGMALILQRLSELETECSNTKEEIQRVKAQKEAAERKADEATQAIRAAKAQPPPASAHSTSSQGGSGGNQYRNQGNYRGRGRGRFQAGQNSTCLLYTSDAADE